MSTDQLVKTIEEQEYILPKNILQNMSEEELIKEIEEIFNKYQEKIDNESEFRRKYMELINYVFVLNIRRDKAHQKKTLFNKDIIQHLLSIPEPA